MDIEKEKKNHAEWFRADDPVAFSLVSSSQEYERDFELSERTWLAAKAQAVPEGFVLVKMDDLELLRDSALEIKYASLNNDSDRIFSDIEDIQLSVERLIEAQEQNQ